MNIACSSCPAKYAVPDEKVRGRKVRITCKRCGAAIIVDGTSLAAGPAPEGTADRPPQQTMIGGVGTNTDPSEGASAPSSDGAATPKAEIAAAAPAAAPTAAKPAEASPNEEATRAEPAAVVQAAARAAVADEQKPAPAPLAEKTAPKPVVLAKPLAAVAKAAGSEAKQGGFPRPGGFGAKPTAAALKPAAASAVTASAAVAEAKPASVATEPLAAKADDRPAAAEAAAPVAAAPAVAAPVAAAKPVFASPFRPMAKAAATAGAASPQPARAVAAPRATATARAVAPSPLPERTWTVAVTDDTHREMTIAEVVEAYAAQVIDAETFIWRDGMQDWLMPFEISEIAAALRARRLSPRTATARDASLGEESGHAGAWREPGRWDRDEPPPSEANFDDVTVAMEAPKAQALLQAVAASEERTAAAARKDDEPTAVVAPSAVTPELLGFGMDDDGSKPSDAEVPKADGDPPKVDEAASDGEERAVERLPFELAQSAAPARAALKSRSGEERPERPDLFARKAADEAAAAERDESDAEPAAPAALTGARNESSVLFSLDQLSKVADTKAPTKSAKGAKKREEDALLLGDPAGGGMQPVTGLGGGLFAPTTMAAPDFTAPPPPSVPPVAARSAVSNAPAATPKKSGSGIWIGVALVALVAAGVVGFLVKGATPPPVPSATPVAATEAPPVPSLTASAAAPAAPADSAAASVSGAPADSAAPAASGAPATGAVPSGPVPGTATPATPAAAATAPRLQTAAAPKATTATAEPAAAEGPDFDKDAAMAALATAASRAESECASQEGTHGTGKVSVTFATSGRATNALVAGDFAGSALGGCVAKVFRSARVPAFGGDSVRVSKTVRIP